MTKQNVQLKIEKLTQGGQGIGYINGKICFVNYVIPGEIVSAQIILEKKDYSVAEVIEIEKPSEHRIEARCPHFRICGGCDFQHINYNYQLILKKKIFIDTLRHIGRIELPDFDIIRGEPWFYRNRAQLPVQKNKELKIGYFKKGTHNVINHKECFINHHKINQILPIIRDCLAALKMPIYDEKTHSGNLRHIIIRSGINTGQIFITFVSKERSIPEGLYSNLSQGISGLMGISQNINPARTNRIMGKRNINLWGAEYYEEKIDKKIFRVGTNSFFQVNTEIFDKIIEKIKSEIDGEIVLDLYAGIGIIGICVSSLAQQVITIEENPDAVNDGITNANLNKTDNIKFIQGDAERELQHIIKADIAILDPPRKGLTKPLIEKLFDLKIKKIIYLSCNPATLARDALLIIDKGYKLKNLTLFDMFPQTYHLESLVVFEQKK